MSQVYGFCKQLGGSVTLSSEVGVGTCITLFLPRTTVLKAVQPIADLAPVAEGSLMMPVPLRALVVDDDPYVLETTSEMLQILGFDVVTADSGVKGMAILRGTSHVDVLMTDFSMAVLTGIELIRFARTSKPGLPCLLMTGFADVDDFGQAAAEKIMVLRKPYKMKDLELTLAYVTKVAALST